MQKITAGRDWANSHPNSLKLMMMFNLVRYGIEMINFHTGIEV